MGDSETETEGADAHGRDGHVAEDVHAAVPAADGAGTIADPFDGAEQVEIGQREACRREGLGDLAGADPEEPVAGAAVHDDATRVERVGVVDAADEEPVVDARHEIRGGAGAGRHQQIDRERADLVGNAERRGEELRAILRSYDSPLIGDVRGAGLLIGVGLTDGEAHRLSDAALAQGLIINAPNESSIRLAPPLIVGDAELAAFREKFGRALASL